MTKLTAAPGWDDVTQLETTTLALGGPGGPMNAQAQALLNRTEWLRAQSVSVKDPQFAGGAKGDGVADDSAAILAADAYLAQAGGGVLRFPRGTYGVKKSIKQSPRVSWIGEGSRQAIIKYIAGDLVNYSKGVVYCVAGTDAAPDFVFSTNIRGICIDANGVAPVSLAWRGHQENCVASDLLLGGFSDAGLDLLPFPSINHSISFEDLHILAKTGANAAMGIRGSHVQKCFFKNITTDCDNTSYYDKGVYLYNNPLLNVFQSIHTEDCKYGLYIEGGANNVFSALEARNGAGNGVAHFYTTATRYQIRGMRTIAGYTNHLQDSQNIVSAYADIDSLELVRGGSYFRRIADTQTEVSRGVISHAGNSGSGRTELLINGSIGPGATRYLEVDLGGGNVGFAGDLSIYSVGDMRYKTGAAFAGYADGAGGVSGGSISAQSGTNTATLTISAPGAALAAGKIRIPIKNNDATYAQTIEAAILVSAYGRQAVGLSFI